MPRSVTESERPDFILEFGARSVGCEITLAVEGEYVRAGRLYPHECVITTNLKDRTPRRSNQEIAQEILSIDGPWMGLDTEMTDWQEKIQRALQSKRAKLNQADFQLFDENWLVVYDFPFLSNNGVVGDRASRVLADIFSDPLKVDRDFDAVFIHSNSYLFRWSRNELTLNYKRS